MHSFQVKAQCTTVRQEEQGRLGKKKPPAWSDRSREARKKLHCAWGQYSTARAERQGKDMTLEQIRRSAKAVLIPTDVAEVLGCAPQSIRDQARNRPDLLGFPVTVVRRRTYIPRVAFLKYLDGENMEETE